MIGITIYIGIVGFFLLGYYIGIRVEHRRAARQRIRDRISSFPGAAKMMMQIHDNLDEFKSYEHSEKPWVHELDDRFDIQKPDQTVYEHKKWPWEDVENNSVNGR